jgi:hypothetical protein
MVSIHDIAISGLIVVVPAMGMAPNTGLWMLNSKATPKVLAVAVGIALAGVLLYAFGMLDQRRLLIAFFAPMVQFAFLRVSYTAFRSYAGRWPMDVVFNWSRGLFADRLFFILTTLVGLLVPALWMGQA